MNTTKDNSTILFCDYYKQWITVYKEGAIRTVTMKKYLMAHHWLEKLVPDLIISDLDRISYQKLLNDYASTHEHQTTLDFHHHITLEQEISWDWFILLVAKTGMRFSEALALTPKDFDFAHQSLSISKTWDYKGDGGFLPTKNTSSVRKIQIDWQTVMQFSNLLKNLPEDEPIFAGTTKVYNSTLNGILARHCKNAGIPVIAIHGLRHTHASLLLFAGVSIASVARRLGHSSMTTTQKTYLHIIQELESKDVDIIMRSLSNLN